MIADRLLAATGPVRALDDEISRLDPRYKHMRIHPYIPGTLIDDLSAGLLHDTPRYTASLDAVWELLEARGSFPATILTTEGLTGGDTLDKLARRVLARFVGSVDVSSALGETK